MVLNHPVASLKCLLRYVHPRPRLSLLHRWFIRKASQESAAVARARREHVDITVDYIGLARKGLHPGVTKKFFVHLSS